MYKSRPSVVIINGINSLGLEIAKRFGKSSSVLVVGNNSSKNDKTIKFPRHVSVIDYDLFSTVKLSKIKNIIILYHEKQEDLISASELVNHAKFLSDIFNVATSNNARVILTTSYLASKQYVFSKYIDKDQPYDFPSMQNFLEKLALEQGRKTPTTVLRMGDVYGLGMSRDEIIYRMVKDAVTGNYVRVDDDGLDKLYPISIHDAAETIHEVMENDSKTGIFTLAPRDGLTQMAFANMCMQYSTSISYIKFVKSKFHKYNSDPMYENIYTPAPFIGKHLDSSKIENDLLLLVKNVNPNTINNLKKEHNLRTEKESNRRLSLLLEPNKKIRNNSIMNYIVSGIFLLLIIFLVVIPLFVTIVNTRLLTDSNLIFINNYNKSLIAELPEDARYNKEKASNLVGALTLAQWIFPIIGDDYKSNENFLDAERDYFEALSYSKDYKFVNVPDVSRSLVQIKLQSAQSHLKSVDKNKLFWDLTDRFDDMNRIINEASI